MEFLIRAHDCYTLGCSVGGIADLLITAQSTTSKLVVGKHFKLMVGNLLSLLQNVVFCFIHQCGMCGYILKRGKEEGGGEGGGERERAMHIIDETNILYSNFLQLNYYIL